MLSISLIIGALASKKVAMPLFTLMNPTLVCLLPSKGLSINLQYKTSSAVGSSAVGSSAVV
jgi:hypothetical protein